MAKAEGKYFQFTGEDQINPDFLETFTFDGPDQYIMTETDEFSAVCPFSGLPDLAYVKIEYYPKGGKCIELKSLKQYAFHLRDIVVSYERLINIFYDHLMQTYEPERLRISMICISFIYLYGLSLLYPF